MSDLKAKYDKKIRFHSFHRKNNPEKTVPTEEESVSGLVKLRDTGLTKI